MTADAFYAAEDLRVLTPEAFEFVLSNELKRAVRSQNFVTLVLMTVTPEVPPVDPADRPAVRLAQIVAHDVRETDLLTCVNDTLALALLDADPASGSRVIDRLMGRLEHYEFPHPLTIAVGAASCPTDATDLEGLRRQAAARQIAGRRTRRRLQNA
ncbi:MAG TPA: hypothetical protein VNI83_07250 [Vicinamibacterales bacterium]|nr:hypothetical protein [Vicinamibacterales bacterium]